MDRGFLLYLALKLHDSHRFMISPPHQEKEFVITFAYCMESFVTGLALAMVKSLHPGREQKPDPGLPF
jgi:hypothetical protein